MASTKPSAHIGEHQAEPWREPPRGGFPAPGLLDRSGLEQLRSLADGGTPRPPIARLTGTRPVEVGAGRACFAMPASGWLLCSQGLVTNGMLAVLADAPLGCSVQSALPPATAFTTSELSLRLVRPGHAGGVFTARGRLVHAARSLALSEVAIHDAHGRLLARGSSLCLIRANPARSGPSAGHTEPAETGATVPESGQSTARVGAQAPEARHTAPRGEQPADPYQREPAGEVLAQELWERLSGREVLEGQLAGELPLPPLSCLFGLRPVEVGDGSAAVSLPASGWLCSPLRRVQGGVTAMLADASLACAIQTTVPAGVALAMVDLKVNFLRPVAADGRELTARGVVVHRGRTMALASAEVSNAEGKPVALASGSAMILPGRAASLAGVDVP